MVESGVANSHIDDEYPKDSKVLKNYLLDFSNLRFPFDFYFRFQFDAQFDLKFNFIFNLSLKHIFEFGLQ